MAGSCTSTQAVTIIQRAIDTKGIVSFDSKDTMPLEANGLCHIMNRKMSIQGHARPRAGIAFWSLQMTLIRRLTCETQLGRKTVYAPGGQGFQDCLWCLLLFVGCDGILAF